MSLPGPFERVGIGELMAEDLLLGDFWDILCLCIVICLILDLLLNKIEASTSCSFIIQHKSKAL